MTFRLFIQEIWTKLKLIKLILFLGGNQRELARAKNQKKNDAGKKKDDGLTVEQRKAR